MKSPREIFLSRHQRAEARLDDVRECVLAGLFHQERAGSTRGGLASLRELFALPRPAWMGLGAAWLVIVGLNLAAGDETSKQPVVVAERTPAARQALAEQRRFYVDLVRAPLADIPEVAPRPRSERRPVFATV